MGASVLISGAGIAGSTLAYWLARKAFTVTLVEHAAGQRSSGHPVDVKGPAADVVEQMGIMPELRAAATQVNRLAFVDADGRERGGFNMRTFQGSAGDREVEIARADLAAILLSAAGANTEIRWGDTITELTQTGDGVQVGFQHAEPERFDLVVGADGLHSTVRRLTFGPEADFIRHMGMYVATVEVDRPIRDEHQVVMVNTPGRAFVVHPASGTPGAAFMFRHPAVPGLDRSDLASHTRMVTQAFAGRLGCFSRYLDQLQAADDLYFDSVSRVRLPHWSTGHVTLLGDAASSLSLFGDGSTLAIAGAHTLAEELARAPADLPSAVARYEQRHRVLVKRRQRGFTASAMLLVPRSRGSIVIRDNLARLLGGRSHG
ncbi:FAD-dependent monooxygenase [Mycobacterium antarcticum]|uniref:FAD-dependent monooxygenase n=1 Tax=Mycolicibacterium sp. TUM20985 TaxID=3023370 RepID=UPI00257396C6|nr:FAD-dependent monooxygenase [Mycolicibacterium sp. TUM20985]